MTFIHDDEVEEVWRVLTIETGPPLVFGDCLVGREIHLTAFGSIAFDLVPSVAKRREYLIFRIVHQDVAVGQVEDSWPPVLAGAVPARVPQFPTDLKSDDGLAGAGGQRQEDTALALQNGLHGAVDRDLLIVAGRFAGKMVIG